MKNKLFVGNLPYTIRDNELADIFSKIGPVSSAQVILERGTSRSKGFGFVEMESEEDAQKAIKELNNADIEGRNIIVNVARPREDR